MDSVEVIEESISEKAVTDSNLTGVIYDRFGEGVNMMPSSEDKILATVKVQLSPTFWGWLFQFGKQMRVILPETVVQEQKERVEELRG